MSIFIILLFILHNCYYEKIGKEVKNITDELPFEIPNSWAWIRLKNLVNIETGKKDANFGSVAGQYDFFTCAMEPIRSKSYSYDGEYLILPGNGANVGKSIHYFGKFEAYQRTYLLSKLLSDINFDYLKINLDARWLEYNKDKLFGSAIPYIKLSNIEEFLIPLPPINEQKKIINKYFECGPLISQYEIIERKLTNLELEFEEKLKASILQYAIEGKLVKQDPNDEPASVLLERIREEKEKLIREGKIQREKAGSIISLGDDKNYYENNKDITKALPIEEIPNSWRWIRLDTLFAHNTGKALNSKNITGENLEYITTSNLYWNNFILNDLKKMYFLPSELQKCTVKKGDLLVCEGGDIGRAAIWNLDKTICIQNHIHRLRPYIFISVEFYLLVLRLYKFTGYIGGKGIGIQGLSTNALGKLFLPLPPIEEQKRISKQVFAILKDYKIAL